MANFETFAQSSTAPEAFYLAKYLDAPILDTDLRRFQAALDGLSTDPSVPLKEHPVDLVGPAIEFCRKSGIDASTMCPIYPSEYRDIWASCMLKPHIAEELLVFVHQTIDPVLSAVASCIRSEFTCTPRSYLIPALDSVSILLMQKLLWWNRIIDRYDVYRSGGGRNHLVYRESGRWVCVSTRLCFFSEIPGISGARFCTYEQLLGWKDAMYVRFNIRRACLYNYPLDPNVYASIALSVEWQELCLSRYGNAGYELAKSTEALSKTYISRIAGGVQLGVHDAYSAALTKHREKEKKLLRSMYAPRFPQFLADRYHEQVLKQCATLSTVVEVFGCQKAISHPLIDVAASGLSAADEARRQDKTSPHAAFELRATWCRIFTEGYIRKHHRWPPLRFTTPGTVLHDMYTRGVLAFSRTSTPLSDWGTVKFGRLFTFDYYPNFLDVADDKAIGVPVSEKASAWDRDAKCTSERRLLLEILRRKEIDHKAIFEMIENDAINPEFKSVVVTPKEREFKLQARMFSMLVLEMRNAATICEANLANTILPYIPQLTMADDKLTVHQRFLDMTRPLSSPETLRLFIELDLSRWNLLWRALCVDMVGNDLNDLFGTLRTYTWIHKFFAECMVYVRTNNNRPDGIELPFPLTSLFLWYLHYGGFEGLAQKLWSICTVAMKARAIDDLPISYTMTAQGDNVVLTVTTARDFSVSEAEQVRLLRDEILERCSHYAEVVNQCVKPEECVDSTTTVTYSKAVYVSGVDYPTTIKSLARLFPIASVDFPSPETYIRSIFAGSLAAAEQAKDGIACYAAGLSAAAVASVLMSRSCGPYTASVRNVKLGVDPTATRHFLTVPPDLGGYSVAGFYQYLYRGSGDPVSKSLASMYLLQKYYPPATAVISRLTANSTYSEAPELESLIKDPYSLPIRRATTPEDAVAQQTLDIMYAHTENEDILDVLRLSTDDYRDELLESLKSMVPFNPVIAHDLYDCSLMGTKEMISKMFITTRSIQLLSRREADGGLTATLVRTATNGLYAQRDLQVSLTICQPVVTPLFELVTLARARWGVTGVTPENITSYLPCDFRVSVNLYTYPTELVLHGRLPPTPARFTRGGERAYLGTRTREKRADHGYRIIGRSFASTALSTLQRIYSWSDQSWDIAQLIDGLATTRASFPLSPYSAFLPTIVGGTAAHRYAARIGHSSAHIMGQSTFASHCAYDSDHAGYLSATKDDYPIMFQEFFLFMGAIADLHVAEQNALDFVEVHLEIGNTPLRALTGERFATTRHPDRSKLPAALPKLVQDPDLRLVRVSGVDESTLLSPRMVDASLLRFQSLCSLLSSKLGAHRRVLGVLDHTVSRISLPIGILELAGMGLNTYVDACAVVIIDTASGALQSRRSAEQRGAGIAYLTTRYGTVLANAIAPLIRHPMIQGDSLVARLGLGDYPTYMPSSATEAMLVSEISRRVFRMSSSPTSLYHTIAPASFASDTLELYGDIVVTAVRRCASWLVLTHQATLDEGHCMVGSTILAYRLRTQAGIQEMLTDLHAHLMYYDARPTGYRVINCVCRFYAREIALSRGQFSVLGCRQASEEVLRDYRSLQQQPRVMYPTVRFPVPPKAEPVAYVPVTDFSFMLPGDYLSKWEFHFVRCVGVISPFCSSAYLTWQHFGRLFEGYTVLVVGAGLGAASAVAALGGAISVYGHDLRTDLPLLGNPLSYVAPIPRICGVTHLVSQTTESQYTSGDWFDDAISSSLLRRFVGHAVVVVDLASERGSSPDVLAPIVRYGKAELYMLRVTTDRARGSLLFGYVDANFHTRGLYRCSTLSTLTEYVLLLQLRKVPLDRTALRLYPEVGVVDVWEGSPQRRALVPRGLSVYDGSIYMTLAFVTHALGGVTSSNPRTTCFGALLLFDDMLQGLAARPSYGEWTGVLHCAAACDLALYHSSDAARERIRTGSDTGLYSLASHPTIRVHFTAALERYLVLYAARLIGHLDYTFTS